jgi:peptidoglycan/xylan/chitin deacetylase (PgdA/CDA1 family)
MLFWAAAIAGLASLIHTAPFRFVLDAHPAAVWRMPESAPPTVYLTIDDGPNPTATPQVLDILARHGAKATFFIIDRHLNEATASIVRRAFEEGHAVALHSHTRTLMFKTPAGFAKTLETAAARMTQLTGHVPCKAFRPHGGNRSLAMLIGAERAGYLVVGWGWMLWDFNWFRERRADGIVPRLVDRASAGDIIVIHDGHHRDACADRRYAIETIDELVPALRAKGLAFGVICP